MSNTSTMYKDVVVVTWISPAKKLMLSVFDTMEDAERFYNQWKDIEKDITIIPGVPYYPS